MARTPSQVSTRRFYSYTKAGIKPAKIICASLHSASLHEECLLAFKRKIKNKENTTVPINTSYNGDRFRKPLGLLAFPHKIPTRMFHIMSHPRFSLLSYTYLTNPSLPHLTSIHMTMKLFNPLDINTYNKVLPI